MMQAQNGQNGQDQAQQVCTFCKIRKRRCNKALPKCSSCSRRNLKCTYLPLQKTSSDELKRFENDFKVNEIPGESQLLDYPTILFLDPGILQHGQIDIPQVAHPVPSHVLRLLGNMDEINATATDFFANIHPWMPFISKKRFYEIYLRLPFQTSPEVVLLILSLKLIITPPCKTPRNPRTALYTTLKHFYLEVEGSNSLSVLVVQAGILISLYELGHAIYPAAFLSIGGCARYASALGITGSSNLNARKVLSLVEVEERRRIWWAIIILDRYVSIGCPGRPFATEDPKIDDLLPADDAAWDQGIVSPDDSFKLSSPKNDHMSKFALLCQAARLLSQVLQHISNDIPAEDEIGIQLDRTLQSMVSASVNADFPDTDQITFVYSALIALHTHALQPDSNNLSIEERGSFQRSRVAIDHVCDMIKDQMIERKCFTYCNLETLSPWGLFFAYRICVDYIASTRKDPRLVNVVKVMKELFVTFDARWNAAGYYFQLIEAHDVLNSHS